MQNKNDKGFDEILNEIERIDPVIDYEQNMEKAVSEFVDSYIDLKTAQGWFERRVYERRTIQLEVIDPYFDFSEFEI